MISVVVPVYKVEAYLDRCVQSIVSQTYQNLEIILVDDGSPDNCPAMCDAWAEKDSRIRVIHKANGGLSDARNVGVSIASGEYIAFVDSDDFIASEMLEILLNRLLLTDSDVASCDALRVWDDDTPSQGMIRYPGDYVLDKTEAMRALIQSTFLIQTAWNKLYKTSLVKKIPFEKGKIHEDEFWSWRVISNASRVATVSSALYYYLQRTGSIMGDGYTGFPMLVVEAKQQRHCFISKELPDLKDIDSENLVNTCFYQGVQIMKHETGETRKRYLVELQGTVNCCEFSNNYMANLTIRKRVRLYLIKHHMKLACSIAKLYGIE